MKEGYLMLILKNCKKTIFSTLIIVILLCCSSQAGAAQEEDYSYTVTDGKATITNYSGSGGDVTIPSTLGGATVTNIGQYAFQCCYSLTSVTIPQGVTSIGQNAFERCSNLTSITIPQSVTSIGRTAFLLCSGLTSITIPQGVTSIEQTAFSLCSGLKSITIPESVMSIGDGAFFGCRCLNSINVDINNSEYTSLDGVLFNKAKTILVACPGARSSINIPPEVTSIGYGAFSYCSGLTSINIPQGVISIGPHAFYSCRGLKSITIPPNVTTISDSAFSYCTELTDIDLPQRVTSIGQYAFESCSALTSITIPPEITSIGRQAFRVCTGLTSITIPQRVTSIGEGAFYWCTALTSMTFESATTEIYDSPDTIPAGTKIIGFDPSKAKDYATKYNRTFQINSVITFTDPNLEAVVREEINKPEGPIIETDVESIYELSIFSRGITSLEGIQNLKNLKGLYAWDNLITDISPLQELTQLQWLDLDEVKLKDFSPLQYLVNLEELSLAFNDITTQLDGILGNLSKLLSLNLKNNKLGETAVTADNIRHLYVVNDPNNLINELGKLGNLTELNISNNKITSIEGLQSLKQLSSLEISNNQINDLTPLQDLSVLQSLNISGNMVSDINPLQTLNNISELDLSSNQITDLRPLSNLTKLSSINLSNNRINNIEALSSLNTVSTIYLAGNQIADYSVVESLPNVEQFTSDAATLNTTGWYTQTGVASDKTWQVKFNAPLKIDTVNDDFVFVKDQEGKRCPVEVGMGSDNCTISVKAPAAGYLPGQSYFLYISNKVQSQSGKNLNSPLKMQFIITGNNTANQSLEAAHKMQGALDNIFLIKDMVSFCYGLNSLVDRIEDDVAYLKQLPEDHFIAEEMDKAYSYADWRHNAQPIWGTDSILSTYNDLFGKTNRLVDASKFLQDLNALIKDISIAVYTKDCSWWITQPLRPINEVGAVLAFIVDWNKIKDGKVVLGNDLKIGGNNVFKVGENDNRLSLTMLHKAKWEWKYLLGTPRQVIPVAQSEQARWFSADPTVATVYKGIITGHKPGKTTISVRYYNKKATWEITVK